MNRAAILIAAVFCTTAFAQDEDVNASVGAGMGPSLNLHINVKDGQQQAAVHGEASRHEEVKTDAFKLTYDSTEGGRTGFKIVAPEGLLARVSENGLQIASDTIPMRFDAWAGHFYRVEIVSPEGVVFDKKFEAKDGMEAVLSVHGGHARPHDTVVVVQTQTAPAASCMESGDFASVKSAIDGESFSEQKLNVLETAIGQRSLCAEQAAQILGSYSFSKDKLQALRLMKPRIADTQNNFKLLAAFTFDSDKTEAKAILGR